MRTIKIIALAATVIVAGLTIASSATIVGTPHDFSGRLWGTTETCKFCHTPHFAQSVSGAPLWNHQTASGFTYTMYSSQTFKGQNQTQPGAASLLCLSCHDGTVAIDSYANAGAMRSGANFISTTNKIGGGAQHSLTTDHPISFTYDSALATADGAPKGLIRAENQHHLAAGVDNITRAVGIHGKVDGRAKLAHATRVEEPDFFLLEIHDVHAAVAGIANENFPAGQNRAIRF